MSEPISIFAKVWATVSSTGAQPYVAGMSGGVLRWWVSSKPTGAWARVIGALGDVAFGAVAAKLFYPLALWAMNHFGIDLGRPGVDGTDIAAAAGAVGAAGSSFLKLAIALGEAWMRSKAPGGSRNG